MIESCMHGGSIVTQAGYHWDTLPAIPDKTGFAGSFAGVANGALIVAGGSNFPNGGTPWNGGKKVWSDRIFVLEHPQGHWKEAGKLPRPLGYGVSVSTENGLICIGGSNAEGHYSDVFLISWQQGQIAVTVMPSLPEPLANACGVMADSCIYVAGGLRAPDAQVAAGDFYMLDLKDTAAARHWRTLPSWPGPARMLGVAGALGHDFFLFSGATLKNGKREYLKDAYRYNPETGWRKCADMPYATVAAPTPALASNDHVLHIFGGDTGKDAEKAAALRERHPGFSDEILTYDLNTDAWVRSGKIDTHRNGDAVTNPNASIWAPVTTAFVQWNGLLVFPGGEVRPGTRTPNVLTATAAGAQQH
ncbi:kelch repeat-containing protein [Chitinophaga rupis]|nr:galactose oxidase [Chitinophaga rupis]